jgi:hypothetical protein
MDTPARPRWTPLNASDDAESLSTETADVTHTAKVTAT